MDFFILCMPSCNKNDWIVKSINLQDENHHLILYLARPSCPREKEALAAIFDAILFQDMFTYILGYLCHPLPFHNAAPL